jgi:dipeptidyl aminopeptidase/acylaminoacyl peptidase
MHARMSLVCLLSLFFALPATTGRAEPRPFEIADYYATQFVGAPALSPDGAHVVFSVHRYDMPTEEDWTNLWSMDADGENLRQLTFGHQHDTDPFYSSDGRWIYFVSDRDDEGSEVYRLSTAGGEAQAVTDSDLDVGTPQLSRDGRWLVVSADVYPDCGGDLDCNSSRDDSREKSKLKVHVADQLLYRHWTSWSDGKQTHLLLVDAVTGEFVRDLTPGPYPAPTFSLGGGRGFDIAPDSRHLVFKSNHDADQAQSTNADLWWIDFTDSASVANPVNLTADNEGWDGAPLISPDGKQVAYLSQATPGYESDLYRIATVDLVDGSVRYHTGSANFDNWISDIRWSPDGGSIYFEGDVKGRGPIYRLDLGKDRVRPVHTDGVFSGWELDAAGKWIYYTRSHIGEPFEMLRVKSGGGKAERLTHFNDALYDEVDFRPAEEISVDSGRGYSIQCWIIKPHDFDPSQRYPLILNVHGGPQGSWSDRYRGDWQVYPGKGYVVAMPNPTGSSGFGQDYLDAISGDWGGRVYEDVMQVTDELAKLPYVDPDRMGAMGWSYGGYMMMWMQGHTRRFQCQVAMMGLYDLPSFHGATEELWFPEHDLDGAPWNSDEYERWSPSRFADRFATPALVITGEKDFRVPYTQSLNYFTDLQSHDVPSRLIVFQNSGHWPNWHDMIFYYNAHLDWFHRYLGGGAAPYDMDAMRNGEVFTDEPCH